MQDTNKDLSALIRSMKRNLKNQHGIDVPHAALRACVLQAQGENPHAFAARQAQQSAARPSEAHLLSLVQEAPAYFHPGYDFDGKKLEWLQRAGLVSSDAPQSAEDGLRTLYIVYDEDADEMALALGPVERVFVPRDFAFPPDCQVLSMHADVPKVARYGLPDYYADPTGFFKRHALQVSNRYASTYHDLGDDSGDSAQVDVRMNLATWNKLLADTLRADRSLRDDVAEWVGTHHGRNFGREPLPKRVEWLERYLEALSQAE